MRYCGEASAASERLRIPAGLVPASRAALDAYLQGMLDSDALAVTSVARELAREVIDPPGASGLGPLSTVARLASDRLVAAAHSRRVWLFVGRSTTQARLNAWCRRIRTARRFVPDSWARWSAARS